MFTRQLCSHLLKRLLDLLKRLLHLSVGLLALLSLLLLSQELLLHLCHQIVLILRTTEAINPRQHALQFNLCTWDAGSAAVPVDA